MTEQQHKKPRVAELVKFHTLLMKMHQKATNHTT